MIAAIAGFAKALASIGTHVTNEAIRTGAKRTAKNVAEEGLHATVPKYANYPAWFRGDPSTLSDWERKNLLQWSKVEKRGWFHPIHVTRIQEREWISQLSHEKGVSSAYVSELISAAHDKVELKTVVEYLRSHAADNMGKWERAQLIAQCFDKMRLEDILHNLM